MSRGMRSVPVCEAKPRRHAGLPTAAAGRRRNEGRDVFSTVAIFCTSPIAHVQEPWAKIQKQTADETHQIHHAESQPDDAAYVAGLRGPTAIVVHFSSGHLLQVTLTQEKREAAQAEANWA